MKDIADKAGVHRVTVSNVLNGRFAANRRDAAERAERIRRIAAEMGYRPHHAAHAMRSGTTGLIGMLRHPHPSRSVHNPVFAAALDAALADAGLCLVTELLGGGLPQMVRRRMVDGLIVNHAYDDAPDLAAALDRTETAAVWVNRDLPRNAVRPDDEAAADWATRRLLGAGHRRIAYVVGYPGRSPSPHYSLRLRRATYEAVVREAGLEPRVVEVAPPPADPPARWGHIARCHADLLRPADRPTAVLCDGDGRTMLLAAARLGLDVPGDLSVVGFDGEAGAAVRVAMTRALVDHRRLAQAAVAMVRRRVADGRRRRTVRVPPVLEDAGTVARPRH